MATNATTGFNDASPITVQSYVGASLRTLTFVAGWTASATGVQGTTADGSTHFVPWAFVVEAKGTP